MIKLRVKAHGISANTTYTDHAEARRAMTAYIKAHGGVSHYNSGINFLVTITKDGSSIMATKTGVTV